MRFMSCTAANIFVSLFQHRDWIIDPESMKRSKHVFLRTYASMAGRNLFPSTTIKIIITKFNS
jgi:hypothetical protein